MTAPVERRTARLILQGLHPELAPAMAAFMRANADHFRPWDPPWPDGIQEASWWNERGIQSLADFEAQRAASWVIRDGAGNEVLGTINFNPVQRGPFQACFLGYKLAAAAQGQGLMREALASCIDFMWQDWNMHRIHANYMPANIRSGRLLASLGFVIEGYAREYLFINGAWQDHVLTSLTQRAWQPPTTWKSAHSV